MKYVLITVGFVASYIAVSLIMNLVFNNPTWINPFSTLLGLGLLTCLILNVIGAIKGFRLYGREDNTNRERVAAWLNLAIVLLFVGGLVIPNIIDIYDAFYD